MVIHVLITIIGYVMINVKILKFLHLEAENSYTEQQLKHTESLQSQLFDEIKGRIVKDDQSVPVKKGDY